MEAATNYGAACAQPPDDGDPMFPGSSQPAPAVEKFEAWAYVELMGHSRIAGRVSEQVIAGRNLLRVDIPQTDGTFRTEFFGGSAIFRITPAEESVIRKIVDRLKPEPVFAFMLDRTPRLSSFGGEDTADAGGDLDDAQEF